MAGIGRGVAKIFVAPVFVVRQSVQSGRQLDQLRLDRRIMRIGVVGRRSEKSKRSVIVMPARLQRGDVGLAVAERAGGGGPAAQFDIAGLIERGFVPADQRLQIAGAELSHDRLVPGELRMRITLGAGEMRHAAARQDHCPQPHRGNDPRQCLAKGVTALHRRLRRQVGIDVNRQDRVVDAEMGERDAHRVIDLGNAGESRVEALPIQLPDEFQTDLARNLPAKLRPANMPSAASPT